MNPLLEIKILTTEFHTDHGWVKAVDSLSLSIESGEILGLVGESGCGKSVTSLSVMGLVPSPPGKISQGEILFDGQDLLKLPPDKMRDIRGRRIAMIFQEPMTSLNPVFTIGNQIIEVIELHENISRKAAKKRVLDLLDAVSIPSPERRYNEYPHQLSGGMRQRVMIAMALACSPQLLIADEPTTALDVTIQAQILELLLDLRDKMGLSILLITHDLGVVAEITHRVAVMYAGKVLEIASVNELFHNPAHPYTRGLLRSIPKIGSETRLNRLETIEGTVPALYQLPSGCAFSPRCSHVEPACHNDDFSQLKRIADDHWVRCILHEEQSS